MLLVGECTVLHSCQRNFVSAKREHFTVLIRKNITSPHFTAFVPKESTLCYDIAKSTLHYTSTNRDHFAAHMPKERTALCSWQKKAL